MRLLLLVSFLIVFKAGAQSAGPSANADVEINSPEISDIDEQRPPMGVDLMAGNSKGVTVYPNPANDHIIVSIAGQPNDKREIRLVTTMGHPVLRLNDLRENTYLLDVSQMRSGIYIVEVISKGQVTKTKWVKQ